MPLFTHQREPCYLQLNCETIDFKTIKAIKTVVLSLLLGDYHLCMVIFSIAWFVFLYFVAIHIFAINSIVNELSKVILNVYVPRSFLAPSHLTLKNSQCEEHTVAFTSIRSSDTPNSLFRHINAKLIHICDTTY